MSTIQIVLLSILGYSTVVSVIAFVICICYGKDEDIILLITCGPVLWVILLIMYFIDSIRFIKEKRYIYSEESYQRFLKVNWKMHRFRNVLLIKNRNSKFSLWSIRIIKNIDEPVEEPIDINKARRKSDYDENAISEDIDEAQDYFG